MTERRIFITSGTGKVCQECGAMRHRDGWCDHSSACLIGKRLNKAAPELLQALKGTAEMLKEATKMFRLHHDSGHAEMCALHEKEAREAIAKAEEKP